jgi:GntR family transcriptional regulator
MPTQVARHSKTPFYHQVYEALRSRIVSGEWPPGHMLPPESELTSQYGVSRITARQALEVLVKEGRIYRERGRGSFVSHPTVEQSLVRIVSFSEDMEQRGFRAESQVLSVDLIPAPNDIAALLGVDLGEELVRIIRLRMADGEPMSLEQAHFVHRFCPGLMDHDVKGQSLRGLMERRYGIRWLRAKQTIRAVDASSEIAMKLKIKTNVPVLEIERVSYSQDEIPIEFLRAIHRGDRYTLYNELRGG